MNLDFVYKLTFSTGRIYWYDALLDHLQQNNFCKRIFIHNRTKNPPVRLQWYLLSKVLQHSCLITLSQLHILSLRKALVEGSFEVKGR